MDRLIIHGGAGGLKAGMAHYREIRDALVTSLEEAFRILRDRGAREAVLHAVRLLEDQDLFNAGTGSKLQADGEIRMSAGLMEGATGRFSGVINVQHIRHPIDVAAHLSDQEHTVLAGEQATDYCHRHRMPRYNPETPARRREYEEKRRGLHGTVGAVALDRDGRIVAGTSTGGMGYETPGRVSDSPTVAGTYASSRAGVSCTGRGEHIVNQAAAARVVTRVEDGLSLPEAVARTIREGSEFRYEYGLIGLDREGRIETGRTTWVDALFYAWHDGKSIYTFLE
jgi:L-asparaginase